MTRARIGATIAVAAIAAAPAAAATKHHHKHKKPVVKTVAVKDDVYGTTKLKIHEGTVVEWKWDAANYDSHNVKLQKGPKGVKKFESPSGTTGIHYKRTFTKAGTYQLYCTIHPDSMTMTVVVKK